MSFSVETKAWSGPLELLLNLVEKRKLFINDVSLSAVADDFVKYIHTLAEYPSKDVAHFIFVASTLILIKSRSLLPSLTLTEEETGTIEDLKRKLQLLQRIREVSLPIKERFGKNIIYPRGEKSIVPVFSPGKFSLVSCEEAARAVIAAIPKFTVLPEKIVQKVITIEEMMERLIKRVAENLKMSFREFSSGNAAHGMEIIVSFLALLELVKRGNVHVHQGKNFEDIEIETHEVRVPRYERF